VGVNYVYALFSEYSFSLWVVGEKVGKDDVGSDDRIWQVVCLHPVHLAHPAVMWRIAVRYYNHLCHLPFQKPTELLYLHLHAAQTWEEEVTNQSDGNICLHSHNYYRKKIEINIKAPIATIV
jgi:hypothetical protein